MQTYDIIMSLVLAFATLWGFWKGFAWQLATLASLILSYLVAYRFRTPVASYIDADPPWNVALAMLLLYIGTSLLVWVGFQFVRGMLDSLKLRDFDRQLGGLVGAATGGVLCVVITLFAVTLLSHEHRNQIIHSKSGHLLAVLLDKSHAVMPAELHKVIHPHLHEVLEGATSSPDFDHQERYDNLPVELSDSPVYALKNRSTPQGGHELPFTLKLCGRKQLFSG